jgi:hypothetical protein
LALLTIRYVVILLDQDKSSRIFIVTSRNFFLLVSFFLLSFFLGFFLVSFFLVFFFLLRRKTFAFVSFKSKYFLLCQVYIRGFTVTFYEACLGFDAAILGGG